MAQQLIDLVKAYFDFPPGDYAALAKFTADDGSPSVRTLTVNAESRAYMEAVRKVWQKQRALTNGWTPAVNATVVITCVDALVETGTITPAQATVVRRMALICGLHESKFNPVCFIGMFADNPDRPLPPKAVDRNDDGLGLGQITGAAFKSMANGPVSARVKGLAHWMQVHPAYAAASLALLSAHLLLRYGTWQEALFRYAGANSKKGRNSAADYAKEPNGLISWYNKYFPGA